MNRVRLARKHALLDRGDPMNHLPRVFHLPLAVKPEDKAIHFSPILLETATMDGAAVMARMKSAAGGLSGDESVRRLAEYGLNVVTETKRRGWLWPLLAATRNPLVILLIVLSTISFLTNDLEGGTVIALMVALGVLLRFTQEARADAAAEKLKAMNRETIPASRNAPSIA